MAASEAEANTLKRAFADLSANEFRGSLSHLKDAAEHLTAGNFADSIRESIHAVESAARALEPSENINKISKNQIWWAV
jgi:hypothetical protein